MVCGDFCCENRSNGLFIEYERLWSDVEETKERNAAYDIDRPAFVAYRHGHYRCREISVEEVERT